MKLVKRVVIVAVLFSTLSLLFAPAVRSAPERAVLRNTTLLEDLTSLNPLVGNSITDWWVYMILYDRLAAYLPPDLHTEPWLAESWEVDASGTTWTLHLVKNAVWHDGTPFTSDDVKFTYEYVKQREVSIWLDEVQDVTEVQAPDPYTVIIKTTGPLSNFPSYVLARMPIVPKHVWETIDKPKEYANQNPIGSGPFKLLEYKPGEYIRFEAFDAYWKGRPQIDELLAKIAVPSDVAVAEVKKGDLDLIGVDTPYVREVESDPNLKVSVSKGIYYDHLLLNCKKYPLSIVEFRRAMAYAIDRQELVNRVLLGHGEVVDAPGGVPGLAFWYNKEVTKYPYDVEKAKSILDELGFKDRNGDGFRETPEGSELKIELLNLAGYPPYVRMGDIISQELAQVGIRAINRPVEWAAQSKAANERTFDVLVWGWTISPEPAQYLGTFVAKEPYWSAGEMENQTFNDVFAQQKAELDQNKRQQLIFKLQEILAQQLPVIPIWVMDVIEAYRADRFTGFIAMPMGIGGIYNKATWLSVRPVVTPQTTTTAQPPPTPSPVEVVPTWVYVVVPALIIVAVASLAALIVKRKR